MVKKWQNTNAEALFSEAKTQGEASNFLISVYIILVFVKFFLRIILSSK
jgi:hypothetical protein